MSVCEEILDEGPVHPAHAGVVNGEPVGQEVLQLVVFNLVMSDFEIRPWLPW